MSRLPSSSAPQPLRCGYGSFAGRTAAVFVLVMLTLGFVKPGAGLHAQATSSPSPSSSSTTTTTEAGPLPDLASRLKQAESTYLYNLRRIHAPLLQEYQKKLETLLQQYSVQGNNDAVDSVQKELQHVRKLLSTTGILPYDLPALKKHQQQDLLATDLNANASGMGNGADPDKKESFTLSLHAKDAISPVAVSEEARRALPLGSIAWNVTDMPAGNYEVLMVYSAHTLLQDEPLLLTLGAQQVMTELPAERATGRDETFRVFRLGNLVVPTDISNQTVTLQNGNPAVPKLRVSNVLFVKGKE